MEDFILVPGRSSALILKGYNLDSMHECTHSSVSLWPPGISSDLLITADDSV